MTNEQAYEVWAPASALWSPWVAPVLFTQLDCASRATVSFEELLTPWASGLDKETAVVLDIEGVDAVRVAVTLARRGMAPVPLFNASPAPISTLQIVGTTDNSAYEAVPMQGLIAAMCWATEELSKISRPEQSSPVFMLDSRRLGRSVSEGMFDNRWMLVPQDFPSAKFLREHGIARVLLVQTDKSSPQADLAHVLLRYQEQGIEIVSAKADEIATMPIRVTKPPYFKEAFYRVLARMGLRRNALGGFGSWAPESGGGG